MEIRQHCLDKSESVAADLLREKTEISYEYAVLYGDAVEKGLFLKEDFERAFSNCLKSYGLE